MLGAAGCAGLADQVPRLPEEYLPGSAGPNVILVIIDSLRRDHVGAYGNPWVHTPTLDAIAAESLLFTHAQPEAMPTLPARRAIYTGMRTWPTSPPRFGRYQEIRGQENDPYRDPESVDEKAMHRDYIILGEGKKARQYLANVQGRKGEEDYFAPRVFSDAMRALERAA